MSSFLAARDFILKHRDDYDAAVRGFRGPGLDRFNWAIDYFDMVARGALAPYKRIRRIEFADLPKTPSCGVSNRRAARRRARLARVSRGGSVAPCTEPRGEFLQAAPA